MDEIEEQEQKLSDLIVRKIGVLLDDVKGNELSKEEIIEQLEEIYQEFYLPW